MKLHRPVEFYSTELALCSLRTTITKCHAVYIYIVVRANVYTRLIRRFATDWLGPMAGALVEREWLADGWIVGGRAFSLATFGLKSHLETNKIFFRTFVLAIFRSGRSITTARQIHGIQFFSSRFRCIISQEFFFLRISFDELKQHYSIYFMHVALSHILLCRASLVLPNMLPWFLGNHFCFLSAFNGNHGKRVRMCCCCSRSMNSTRHPF